MRIYLASGYSWRVNLRFLAKKLEEKGHRVTSCWITLDERPDRDSDEWNSFADKICRHNLEDLNDSDCLVIDARGIRKDGNGGAWSELGFALARDWPIYFIGDERTNTFLWSDRVTVCSDTIDLLAKI